MAMIVPSGLIQDITGSTGSYTYGKWKGIHYIRLKAATVSNPRTPAQQKIRDAMRGSAEQWRALESWERAIWSEYAQGRGSARSRERSRASASRIIRRASTLQSGINAWVGVNQSLVSVALDKVTKTPSWMVPPGCQFKLEPGGLADDYGLLSVKGRLWFATARKKGAVQVWLEPLVGGAVHKYVYVSIPFVPPDETVELYHGGAYPDALKLRTVRVGHGVEIEDVPWNQYLQYPAPNPYVGQVVAYIQARLIYEDGSVGPASEMSKLICPAVP